MNKFYWKGICNKDRNAGISSLEKIISEEGYILQFKFFSDVQMSLIIEIEENKVNDLYQKLKQEIHLNSDTLELQSNSCNDAQILLSVSFSRGTGDLRIEIPEL
jgi:hypothetical protein